MGPGRLKNIVRALPRGEMGRQTHPLQCSELNTGGSHPPSTCKLERIWKQGLHGCNKHNAIAVLSRSVRNIDTATVEDSEGW